MAELKELTKDMLDFSIESTNGANLVSEAIEALGIRGTCAMVGGAKMTATVKYNHPDVLLKGKRIIGVMGGGGQTPMFLESLMELQRDGRFPLQKLVKFYDFEDINRAIDDSDDPQDHQADRPDSITHKGRSPCQTTLARNIQSPLIHPSSRNRPGWSPRWIRGRTTARRRYKGSGKLHRQGGRHHRRRQRHRPRGGPRLRPRGRRSCSSPI